MNTLQKVGTFIGDKLSEVYLMLKTHVNDRWNPHRVTKEQVGLGQVDNTPDRDKPVSTAQQQALDGKIDREEGKELVASVEVVKLANIGTYLSESTGFRAEADGSWSLGLRSRNPAEGTTAVHDFTLPLVGEATSGLMPPEYKQAIDAMGAGGIVIPADFTKGTTALTEEVTQIVQERLADGTLFKKPVYLLYSWKQDYTSGDAPVYYSLVPQNKEEWSVFGKGYLIVKYFNSPIVVTEPEYPDYKAAYCIGVEIRTVDNRVKISWEDYVEEHPVENIYLTENGDGIIDGADKNWYKLYDELTKNNHPQVSLKTPGSGMYCPVSYEFTAVGGSAVNPVYSGTMEISYVKEADGVRELWVETRVIPDFCTSASYNFNSYLKKYPLKTGNKALKLIGENGECVVYDGSAEITVQIPRTGRSIQVRGLNEHGYLEVNMYDCFLFEMDLIGISADDVGGMSFQKVHYEDGKWVVGNDYSLNNAPEYSFHINMVSITERGYYRWQTYYVDERTMLGGILRSDITYMHVIGKDKDIVPIDPIAFYEGYELYNPFMPDGEDNRAGVNFKLYGFTESVTGKIMKYTDGGWVEYGSAGVFYPYVGEDFSVAGTYKFVLTDEGQEVESGEFRVKERNAA